MSTPLVSIITPVYNSERYIVECMDSVRAQTTSDWEQIVIDDCSTDSTTSLVKDRSLTDARVRLLSTDSNQGAARARNIGIRNARGRYIAFLDSDDLWDRIKLERQLEFMKSNNIHFSFTAYRRVVMDSDNNKIVTFNVPRRVSYESLLRTCYVGCLTAMYDADAIGKVEMPDILKRQDYGLWLKILKMGVHSGGLDEPLATFRRRAGSLSSNKLMAALYTWRLYRSAEGLSFLKSLYYFSHYAINHSLRHVK